MSTQGFVCWREEDARVVLTTEALQGSRSAFLATHLPITEFTIHGSHGSEVAEPTEQALLNVLSHPSRDHAFCVVEGEPGSGKSHMIRWMEARWTHETDLVVLIQRADGSLEGTLNQLSQKMPERHQHLFAALGRRQEMTLQGRSRTFLANLSVATRLDSFSEDVEHSDWCDRYQLDSLLNNQAVQDNWTAPGRILKILSGGDGDRNSSIARFTFPDVGELADLQHLMNKTLSPRTMQLTRRLHRESDRLRDCLKSGLSEEQIRLSHSKELTESITLIDALNVRLNHAIQNLLGISAHGLRELFFTLRRELKKEGRRLVLLLEDITNFQGVDNQLIDVLVTQSSTRTEQDFCDLISVVGITPAYLREHLRANYQARITHHVQLGSADGSGQHQDVANLRNAESQVAFAANYLRAVRAGLERLESWAGNESQPVPNICNSCPRKEQCHESFGEYEGVGLYPFTARAVVGMFARLEDPRKAMTHRTPRGIIQGILTPTLLNAHTIEDGSFPSPKVDIAWLPESSRRLAGVDRQFLSVQIPDLEIREQFERLITLWGDQSTVKSTRDAKGLLRFAGIPKGVYDAFGLPWLGDETGAVVRDIEFMPSTVELPKDEVAIEPRPKAIDGFRSEAASIPQKTRQTASTTSKPARAVIKGSELELRRNQLRAWKDGKPLEQSDYWNQLCVELVEALPWPAMDIPNWVRAKFFTKDLVKIDGTGKVSSIHFVVPAEPWLKTGLESYLELRQKTTDNVDYHRRTVSRMSLLLRECIQTRAWELLPKVKGKPWSAEASLAQILVAANWVTNRVSPEESLSRQWLVMIGREELPGSDGTDRTEAWKRLVEQLRLVRSTNLPILLEWITISAQDDGSIFTSPAEVFRAMSELRLSLKFDEVPQDIASTQQWAELRKISSKVTEISKDFCKLPGFEKRRIVEGCKALDALLRGRSLSEHMRRIVSAAKVIGEIIPVSSNSIVDFHRRVAGLQETVLKDPPTVDLTDFVDQTIQSPEQSDSDYEAIAASVLEWTLKAPVAELRATLETLRVGEKAITDLMHEVLLSSDSQQPGGDEISLERVHVAGQRLLSISDDLQRSLAEGV